MPVQGNKVYSIDERTRELIEQLAADHSLSLEGYRYLVEHQSEDAACLLAEHARAQRSALYGNDVFIRGLVEVSSYCSNNCYYCGLRVGNTTCERYRLEQEEILERVKMGHGLGFRTFVLQAGEDPHLNDAMLCETVSAIKELCPDSAVTLSLGERSRESYAALRAAGADRYLLRHEAADSGYYAQIHPPAMSHARRMACLETLRELGFAAGAGFMVGAPGQTAEHVAADLAFIEQFKPEMCGIGPFVPHHATPYAHEPAGTLEQTCYLLSIVRLIHPPVLLPATTALGTIHPQGRELGILAGANVVMPNLSPPGVRSKYAIYDNKANTGVESAEGLAQLDARLHRIGYKLVVDRGDPRAVKRDEDTDGSPAVCESFPSKMGAL